MNTKLLLHEIDLRINRLIEARDLLTESAPAKRRGRPPLAEKSAKVKKARTSARGVKAGAGRKRRRATLRTEKAKN